MRKVFRFLILSIVVIFSSILVYVGGFVIYALNRTEIDQFVNIINDSRSELYIALLCIVAGVIIKRIVLKITAKRRRETRRLLAIEYFKRRLTERKEPKIVQPRRQVRRDDPNGWSQFIDASKKGFL